MVSNTMKNLDYEMLKEMNKMGKRIRAINEITNIINRAVVAHYIFDSDYDTYHEFVNFIHSLDKIAEIINDAGYNVDVCDIAPDRIEYDARSYFEVEEYYTDVMERVIAVMEVK